VLPHQILPGGFVAAQASRNEAARRVQAPFYQIVAPVNTHHAVKNAAGGRVVSENPKS
jgi:hypothetical protein